MKTIFLLLFFLILPQAIHAETASLSYFPENYEKSKDRFLKYVSEIEKKYHQVSAHQIVVGKEKLTIDSVFIPAQQSPKQLVIITSGNHGPEGYAGSALQAQFIEKTLNTMDLSHTGILMIHAMNPWGFKYHRRGTENNVNLNRNFDLTPELFQTQNEGYSKLIRFLELKKEARSCAFPAKDLLLEMVLKKSVTQQSLTEAIGKGQYESERGINFGGHDFESQTPEVIALLKQVSEPYPAIFHIDLHTGLGKKKTLHVMTKNGMNEVSLEAQARLFDEEQDAGVYELTPPEAEGFYEIQGDYANILRKLFPEQNRVIIGVTAEFGTVGNGLLGKVITINRLVLENEGYYYGFDSPRSEQIIKKRFLELFNPSDLAWRSQVLTKGNYFLDTVVKRFVAQNP